jgi:hypothetical protein
VLQPARVPHHLGSAGQHGPERAAEALREAERHRVEARADLRRVDPERDRRVQQPRAVEVEAEVKLERERLQLVDLLERPDPPTGGVVSVLYPENTCARRVDRGNAIGGPHLLDGEAAAGAGQTAGDDTGVDRGSSELGDEDVAVLLADELVAGLGVKPQRNLVRHRRGRKEDRLLLAEQPRGTLLELVHGRVLALLLVADSGGRDRGTHPLCRPRGGVGAEVDHWLVSITYERH